ncbi:protein of unknown function DUF4218 [Dillenia turbinata]|uniref:DUF4218 domain-containing protein n=1 Tax=Dillenia turbinata TaxID=194707 RepID=A0AAN8UQN0_9MAGN
MRILKGYVHNKAQPQGCIAERYIDKESLTFYSMYLNDVETIFNKVGRNSEMKDNSSEVFVFSCRDASIVSDDSITLTSQNFHALDDSFLDDDAINSSNSESSEKEELWQDDSTDLE